MALYAKVLSDFAVCPEEIQLGVGMRHAHLDGNASILGPGELNSIMQHMGHLTHGSPIR